MTHIVKSIILLLISTLPLQAQHLFKGEVFSVDGRSPLVGATISWKENNNLNGTQTLADGSFSFSAETETIQIKVQYIGYEEKTMKLIANQPQTIYLKEQNTMLQTATVTSGRYEIPLSEVTVTLEKFEPQFLRNANINTLDQGMTKVPGVEIIDGQANIRGGAGFSYGAGSRVLVLIDDIPYLRADAGAVQWDDIPIENMAQVEVIKGAASALYGSSALNGVINIRTAYATNEPETRMSTFYTAFDKPKNQAWWDENPFNTGFNFSHKQRFGKLDLIYSRFSFKENSFNKNSNRNHNRDNLNLRYRIDNQWVIGAYGSINQGEKNQFFYWKSLDSLYVGTPNTLTKTTFSRYNIDPYITFTSKNGASHKLLNRYYFALNDNSQNRATESDLWYSNYQYQKKFTKSDLVFTGGLVFNTISATAQLYSDTSFNIKNYAAYAQWLKGFGKLIVSAGFRYELNQLRGPELFNPQADIFTGTLKYDTLANGGTTEGKPVMRLGLNYQLARATYLRASWGQGYRFPTLAEQFVNTDLNGTPISPNAKLESETGWSSELGIKQGFKYKKVSFYLDLSVFWNQYQNMIEFNLINLFPTGFQSLNVGDTDIKGLELSTGGQKTKGNWRHFWLGGYNYLRPTFQTFDPSPKAFSNPETQGEWNANRTSSTENILKYRFEHSIKFDYQLERKRLFLGVSFNYLSQMKAIDAIFENFIVPGLQSYREQNNKGTLLLNLRGGMDFFQKQLRVNLLVNNLLNKSYSLRPGLMEAPRSVGLRLDLNFNHNRNEN